MILLLIQFNFAGIMYNHTYSVQYVYMPTQKAKTFECSILTLAQSSTF